MAPLERAVALAEVDAVAVAVEQDLDLDVARALEEPLEDEAIVAERGLGLAPGGGELGRQLGARCGPCACPCRRRRPRA